MRKLLVCFVVAGLFFSFEEPALFIEKIVSRFRVVSTRLPQEKLYLHTDKDFYIAGEKMYFRGYLLNAATHRWQIPSNFVYVELIDKQDSLVCRIKSVRIDSCFFGHLNIPAGLLQGTYSLTAYTYQMQNNDPAFFFRKKIRIVNSKDSRVKTKAPDRKKEAKQLIADIRSADDFDVQFFPEGGALLSGTRQKVAFKAICNDGASVDVSCDVYMDTVLVAHTRSLYDGMGVFSMPVSLELPCHAVVRTQNGVEKQFELPRPTGYGFGLSVRQEDTLLHYNILLADRQKISQAMYVVAHCRGNLISVLPLTGLTGTLDLALFPEGINHLVLIDEEGEIYSQRLFFKQRGTEPVSVITPDKSSYSVRELVCLEIGLEIGNGFAGGTASLSVTDDSKVAPGSPEQHILSSLLLTSDLKGYIENPTYYFQDRTPEIDQHLDLLMMTHGWTRFNVSDVIRGHFPPQPFAYEAGQVISGNLKGNFSQKNVGTSGVMLLSSRGTFSYIKTDEKGNFLIDEIVFPEGTQFALAASKVKGDGNVARRNMTLRVDPDLFPPTRYFFPYRKKEKRAEEDFLINSAGITTMRMG